MHKFQIFSIVGMANKGDAAILKSMLQTISDNYSDSSLSIFTPQPIKDKQFFEKFGTVHQGELFRGIDEKSKLFQLFYVIFKTIRYLAWMKLKFIPIDNNAKNIFNYFKESDLTIYPGGGYIGGPYHTIRNTLLPMYFCKKLGKRIYLSGVTIEEPQGFFIKKITKFILNHIDLITVREPTSLRVLEKMKIKSKKILTSDYAFLLGSESSEVGENLLKEIGVSNNNKLRIGINLKDWNSKFTNVTLSEVSAKNIIQYRKTMVQTIEKLILDLDAIIVIFPFETFSNNDDLKLSKEIKAKIQLQMQNKIFILEKDYTPEQLKTIIGRMNIFIGTRFHSAIFSLSKGIPTISISYMQKNRGLMEMANLDNWLVDFDTLNSEQLVKMILKLLKEQKKIIEQIKNKIPQLQERALLNIKFISKMIS